MWYTPNDENPTIKEGYTDQRYFEMILKVLHIFEGENKVSCIIVESNSDIGNLGVVNIGTYNITRDSWSWEFDIRSSSDDEEVPFLCEVHGETKLTFM